MGKFEDKMWQQLRESVLDADLARGPGAPLPPPPAPPPAVGRSPPTAACAFSRCAFSRCPHPCSLPCRHRRPSQGAPALVRVIRVVEQQEALEKVNKQRLGEVERLKVEELRRERVDKEAAAKVAAGAGATRKKRMGAGAVANAAVGAAVAVGGGIVAVGGGIFRTAGAVAGVTLGAVGAIASALPLPGVGLLMSGPDLSDPNVTPAEMAAAVAAQQKALDLAAVAEWMKVKGYVGVRSKGYRAKAIAAVRRRRPPPSVAAAPAENTRVCLP